MGVIFALINGVPLYIYPINNDGLNALKIKRDYKTKRDFWIKLKINEQLAKGKRLRDMPAEWFGVENGDHTSNPMNAAFNILACMRAMDALDFETAKKIGHYLLAHDKNLIGISRHNVTMVMIFCELIGENRFYNIETLESKDFKKYIQASSKLPEVNRFLYAYELFYHHDEQKAQKHLKDFEKAARNYPYEGAIENERELLAYAQKTYKEKCKKSVCFPV